MIRELTYTQFTVDFHQNVGPGRIPLSGTIEVSHRCPLACLHCYNNLPMNDRAARDGEMTTAEHKRLVDQIVDEGGLWLLYTGGEIFARPDFLEIYRHAKSRGMMVTLFTNGTMITPKIADVLAEYRPFGIEITLYGATRETYERMTRLPGSFDRCHRGIELLLERKLPLGLKTVVTTHTLPEVLEMRSFAKERGLDFVYDPMINPRTDCSQSPLEVRLSPHEVVAMDILDPERETEWRRFNSVFAAEKAKPRPVADELYTCGGGMNSYAIDPAGKMTICVLSHKDEYDVRAGSFREGWNHFLAGVRRRKITRPTKCTECKLIAMCGMCPANGELENGDPEKPVDYLCHISHLRTLAMDEKVPPHGPCEYCPGGARHAELVESLAHLRRTVTAGGSQALWDGRLRLASLPPPEPESGCGSGGCSGCGVSNLKLNLTPRSTVNDH